MAKQGKNAGIRGVLDLPSRPSGEALIQVLIRGWNYRISAEPKQRFGRGSGKFAQLRRILTTGSLIFNFRIRSESPPTPAEWDGVQGNVIIQYTKDKTITIPVEIGAYEHSFTPRDQDTWGGTITGTPIGPVEYSAAWGDAPLPSARTKADQQQYAGTTKTIDPNGLNSRATVYIDIWGDLEDTDDAEQTKLTDVLTDAVAPITGGKKREGTFQRDAQDGGTIVIEYGLRDTKDDIEMSGTYTATDASDIESEGKQTSVYNSGDSPTAADIPSGLQAIRTTINELNDGKKQVVYDFAPNTTAQKYTFAASFVFTDPQGLESQEAAASFVSSDPTLTTSLQNRGVKATPITPSKTLYVKQAGTRSTKDDIELPGTWTLTDNSTYALESTGKQTSVYTTSGSVTAASVPSGLQKISTKITRYNDTKSVVEYDYKINTPQQDLEYGSNKQVIDPSLLEDSEIKAQVTNSSTPPSTPTPANTSLALVNQWKKQLTSTGNWLHVFEFGWVTNQARIEFENSFVEIDASGLETREVIAQVNSSLPATPTPTQSGMQLTDTRIKTLRTGKNLYVFSFAFLTNAQKITFPKTTARSSVMDIYDRVTASIDTVADTVTAAAHADSIRGSNYSDATFDEVETVKLTPTQILKLMRNSGSDKMVIASGFNTELRSALGFPQSLLADPFNVTFNETSSYVRVARISAIVAGGPGGATAGLVLPYRFKRTFGTVKLFRRIVTTYANLYGGSNYLHLDACGSVNNAVFCGFPANRLMYQGADLKYSRAIADGTAHLGLFEYTYLYDSAKHFDDGRFPNGWLDCKVGTYLTSPTFYDPVATFAQAATSDWDLQWPGTWDYSVMLA